MTVQDSLRGHLPDLLTAADGEAIRTAESWRHKRRPEILELFRTHVYGRASAGRPQQLQFELVDCGAGWMEGRAVRKIVDIVYRGGGEGKIRLTLFIPAAAVKPVPAFLLICNRETGNIDPDRKERTEFWPAEEIVARGYAAATFHLGDVDPDQHDGFQNGVHGIFDAQDAPRAQDAWGTLAAWAWGASRAMDYFESDPDIDERRVAVVGHSRGGKAALWSGAQDERFAMTVSNDSGCGGAAITRGKAGETVKNINDSFPHWFCGNFKQYNEREDELPVDQHMLLALLAPRLLYVASATEDTWADPQSEFLACALAEPVYQLFGLKGTGTGAMPEPESPLQQGSIGYHLRTGEHDLTLFDWTCYMDYADRHMK